MSDKIIEIRMPPATVTALLERGFSLVGFRVVATADRKARGLLAFRRRRLAMRIQVGWSDALEAWTAFEELEPGRPVIPGFSRPLAPGRGLVISAGGIGEPASLPGVPIEGYGFRQDDARSIRCGLASPGPLILDRGAVADEEPTPFCGLDLLPGFAAVVVPTDRWLLCFVNPGPPPGTPVDSLLTLVAGLSELPARAGASPGVLVDATGVAERRLEFDLERGWSALGAWARPVPSTAELDPILVERSSLR